MIIEPKAGCKKCRGRGYVGLRIVKEIPHNYILCGCIIKNGNSHFDEGAYLTYKCEWKGNAEGALQALFNSVREGTVDASVLMTLPVEFTVERTEKVARGFS